MLYAENELFNAELAEVRSQAKRYAQFVNVYQAVGGGWVAEPDWLAPPLARLANDASSTAAR